MITTPFSVKLILRSDRKKSDSEHAVYVRIIVDRKKAELFTYQYADPKLWNAVKGRFKGTSQRDNYLNRKLSEIETKIYDVRDQLEREKKVVCLENVRDALKNASDEKRIPVPAYFDKFIDRIKKQPKEYSPAVVQQYVTTKVHFAAYMKSVNKSSLTLQDLNPSHLAQFEEYLLISYKNTKLNIRLSVNTANKYLARLRTVLRSAARTGAMEKSPFDNFQMKKNKKVMREALTEAEIKRIAEHKLSDNASLKRVRDIFLFSVYTGLRFSDATNLKGSDIKKDKDGRLWILSHQKKTGDPIQIPLFKQAKKIYDKYRDVREATGFVLPKLSHQKFNAYLKDVACLAGVKKKVTHHIARHTFATTILLNQDVGIETVSSLLGHTSLKSTSIYAKVTATKLSAVADRLDNVRYIKKKPKQ